MILHMRDNNNNPCVLVPLGKGTKGTAILYEDDFGLLEAMGLSTTWDRNPQGYVMAPAARARGKNLSVARVLLDAGPGQLVRFRNGDTLDLRRDNLSLEKNERGRRRDRDYLAPQRRGRKVEHVYR